MKKIFSWILEHKKIVVIICIMLIIGGPIIIHILFSIPAVNDFFLAKWSAGDLLQYYASILGLIPTTFLSIAALTYTMYVKEDEDKNKRKVNIWIKDESCVTLVWWSFLKHLEVPFFILGNSVPEYVVAEAIYIYSPNKLFNAIKLKDPRNLMSSIKNMGNGNFIFDITLNDNEIKKAIEKFEKISENYCKGFLTEDEFVSNTSMVISLNLGVYCGGIVTPMRVTLDLKWDLKWKPENGETNIIKYRINNHEIFISSAIAEKDYEKQWK